MRRVCFFLFGLLMLAGQKARAAEFEVALANMPPYAIQEKGGASGILVDITKEAFHRLGHNVHFVFYPWPRAIESLKNGKVNAIAPFFKTTEREGYALFPGDGLVEMQLRFFKKKESPLLIHSIKEAAPYRIVKVDRANLGDEFSQAEKNGLLDVRSVSNTTLGLRVLASGRIDLLASVQAIAEYAAGLDGLRDKIESAGPAFAKSVAYLAFSKEHVSPEIAETFSREIASMKKTGRLEEIYNSYLK